MDKQKRFDIAVIGIGLNINDAKTLSEYWEIFNNQLDSIRSLPENRVQQISDYVDLFLSEGQKPKYYKGTYLERIDEFDNEFFRISPKEAQAMDPVQRIMLQVLFSTFDDASYTPEKLNGTKTGIYLGYTANSIKDNYLTNIAFRYREYMKYAMVGNMAAMIPSRASHILNLQGPTMVIDTACSSSLVAVHQACEAIRDGLCDMAIAGGIKLNLMPLVLEEMQIGIEAGDDKTRTFDDFASGASIGEGFACVLLKSLRDAERDRDHIYAVIRGSAINHDGNSSSITAPNPTSQKKVILEAIKRAEVNPENIGYIETHGTGTILGDPIEFKGMTQAFEEYTHRKQFCALSSAKGYIGHLYECAGIASFIKAVAALYYKKIPGMRHFSLPSQKIDFCDSPFYVNLQTRNWDTEKPRICGISAFGLSGTNCHIILEEYPEHKKTKLESAPLDILAISAKSSYSLQKLISTYKNLIKENSNPINLIRCINSFRSYHPLRIAIIFKTIDEVVDILDKILNTPPSDWNKISNVYYSYENIKYHIDKSLLENSINFFNRILCEHNRNISLDLIETLNTIAKAYVTNIYIDWDKLYKNIPLEKVFIPPYPFVKNRLWLPEKKISLQYINASKEEDITYKNEIPWFYERYFTPFNDINNNCENCENCLFVDLGDSKISNNYTLLKNKFRYVETLNINIDEAINSGIEQYFDNKYRCIDFSNITHVLISSPIYENSKIDIQNRTLINMFSLICLYREIFRQNTHIQIYILLKSFFPITGTESLNPDSAPVYGLCKSLNREFKEIHSCCVECDEYTDTETLLNEICHTTDRDIILYRDNIRYIEGIREKELQSNEDNIKILKNGVYLFSGGLGGIAYEVVYKFAQQSPDATFILIGRRPEPTAIDNGKNDNDIRRLRRLQQLRGIAKNTFYIQCDVSNSASVTSMINHVTNNYGKINGIIHAAGIGGGISIDKLDINRVSHIIAPKIFGTYNLDLATRDQNLDFFVMFSSIATVFSSSDLADYAAGNLFMDSYCNYRAKICGGNSITVNWATWSETGMSVSNNFTIDTLFKSIKTNDGIRCLLRTMANKSGNTIIGQMNLDNKIALLLRTYPVNLSTYLEDSLIKLEKSDDKIKQSNSNVVESNYEQYSSVEKEIMEICSKHLGYENINLQDNFFELGADSIILGMIFRDLDEKFTGILQVTDLFSYPTVGLLAEHLTQLLPDKKVYDDSNTDILEINTKEDTDVNNEIADGIAIIGIGINLPNADTLDQYWEMLSNGISTVREMPEERGKDIRKHLLYMGMDKNKIKFRNCGYLDNINMFDYTYFNMSPKEASLIDPVNRMFLECCAKAIDDSGYGKDKIKGSNTGVFLGYTSCVGNAYSRLIYELDPKMFADSLAVSQPSMAASRVAYIYDLKGPSMVLDTACSSAHVAIHMACEQIRSGRCKMALAGGASITQTPFAEGFSVGFESEEYVTRTFSEQSTGSAIAEGVGALLLKDLKEAIKDRDSIYAVIKGTAINQDGSSFGIAAPNYLAQSEVIQEAWQSAGVKAEDICYIEAHGTGTQLGDPIEINGITNAFRTQTESCQICGIGSVKTNMGHANEASGVCGIVKSILILNNKLIPPSLNFTIPNLNIDFMNSPVYVVNKLTPLKSKNGKVYIGASGFGMSGTNAHIILTKAPVQLPSVQTYKDPIVFTISAKSFTALKKLAKLYYEFLQNNSSISLRDFCYTATAGRGHFQYRFACIVENMNDILFKLKVLIDNEKLPQESWLYYGHYSIVPTSKKDKMPHEITRTELKQYTNRAVDIINDHNSRTANNINELMSLYIKGAEIIWKDFYSDTYSHIHIPVYPFERQYCWYPIPDVINENIENGFFYGKKWISKDNYEFVFPKDNETTLLFLRNKDEMQLFSSLNKVCKDIIPIYRNSASEFEIKNKEYYINGTVESYVNLFLNLKQKNIVHIIYTAIEKSKNNINIESVYNQIDDTFFDAINLIKGLGKAHLERDVSLSIVTNQVNNITGEEDLYPQNAPVLSLVKVIEQEYPNILCKGIDIDLPINKDVLANEIFSISREYITGIRKGNCYIEESIEVQPEKTVETRIVENGVYLITGGTSGIGLALAEYISKQKKCKIILLSRSGFIDESRWNDESLDKDIKQKIGVLFRIKDNGCVLDIIRCDVADETSVKSSINYIHKKYGRIFGIIHSAGISGAGYILRKEKDSFLKVLDPKVKGALNLTSQTVDDNLDFLVLCSSAVTDSGEAGQSDYVAANSFLDAFTEYQNLKGCPTYTINWVSWKETGMAVRYGINVDTITKALTTQEAVDSFHKFLCSKPGRVLIGQYNISKELLTLYQYSRNRISDNIIKKVQSLVERQYNNALNSSSSGHEFAQIRNGTLTYIPKSDKANSVKTVTTNIVLEGDPQDDYTKTEKMWQKFIAIFLDMNA